MIAENIQQAIVCDRCCKVVFRRDRKIADDEKQSVLNEIVQLEEIPIGLLGVVSKPKIYKTITVCIKYFDASNYSQEDNGFLCDNCKLLALEILIKNINARYIKGEVK